MLQLSKEDIEAIADAVAARSRHASGAQPDSACDEIGWLVEITGPRYWTGTPGCGNWTADSRAAMRFARRQDAEAACRHLAPSGAIPVEHAWVSHRPAGAQPSGAPAKWRVEVVHGRARVIVDASGDSGEQSFWINDADTDDEPGHAEFHARMLRIAISRIVGAPALASAQGEVCECGHGRAMHFDEDGDHNGACLYQMNDKPFCRCDMFRAKDKERA